MKRRPTERIVPLSRRDQAGKRSIQRMAEIRPLEPEELSRRNIIYPGTPSRDLLDAVRNLRTVLLQKAGKKNFVLLVSSVCPGAGGSFLSLNLGAAFALDSSKTSLVMDCNIMDPSLDDMLSIPPDYGLTDYLENPRVGVDDIIYSSGIARMRLVPAGRRSELGPEIFSSDRMAGLIASLRDRYDDRYIVLDAPPTTASAELRVLAELCDQAILVVPRGKVTLAQISAGVEVVGKNKFSGIVFND